MRKPGTWIAAAALFVALGGTAVAAKHYLITSTHQIKPSVLHALRGHAGPRGKTGLQGAHGPQGPSGPQGAAGPTSLSALTTALYGGLAAPGQVTQVTAFCAPGSRAVSGGGESGVANLEVSEMIGDRSGWFIIVENRTVTTVPIHAEAYCAAAGQAIAAAVRSPGAISARKRDEAKIAALVARLIAEREATKPHA